MRGSRSSLVAQERGIKRAAQKADGPNQPRILQLCLGIAKGAVRVLRVRL